MDSIRHLGNEKGNGAEMFSIHGSGIVTGVAPVNLIPRPYFSILIINHTREMILGQYIIQG